ncbi:MAG: hypothetical protein M3Z64_04905 [Verrucomicrobiota bacterium]|nr:hypothetical protein [Verrucomicrobiota bacterium]
MSTTNYQRVPIGLTEEGYGQHGKRKRFLDLITAWERFCFPVTTLLHAQFDGEILTLIFHLHYATIHGAGLHEIYEQLLEEKVQQWIRMMSEAECLAAGPGKVTIRSIRVEKGRPE